jgi:mono/diheme cytochrome c family protein/DNA-binding beta-propeller fold protein YncE
MQRLVLIAGCLSLAWAAARAEAAPLPALDPAAAEKVSFRRDVWPVLRRHCWGCHSDAKAEGKLDLSTVAAMKKGGESGPLFVPGKPDESLLVTMITGDKPEMPQKEAPLSAAKVNLLRSWILAGAKDDSQAASVDPNVPLPLPETYRRAPSVRSVAFSPDGTKLAAACGSEVVLLDPAGEAAPVRLATPCDLVTHVEFSPDGKLLAVSGGTPAAFGEVRFFDAATGKSAGAHRVSRDTLFRGSFLPDGSAIAVGSVEGIVFVVPVDPKGKVRRLDLHPDWIFDVAVSPDGKFVVTAGRDKATKVALLETGEMLRQVDSVAEMVMSAACTETEAISAGRTRQVVGYDIKTALQGSRLDGPVNNGLRPVSNKQQYLRPYETQGGEVFDLATTPDRRLLAVAGASATVAVIKTADKQKLATVTKVPAPVFAVALDAAGTRLALGTADGHVQIHELPSGTLLRSVIPVPMAE